MRFASALLCLGLLVVAVPALAAAIDVTVEGVDGDLRDNVELRLAIRLAAERKDLDQGLVEALHQRAPGDIREALQPFGYYRPEIDATLSGEKPRWRARYRIQLGPRTHLRDVDVRIEGEGAADFDTEVRRIQRRLEPGDALLHARYEESKALLASGAYARGYLDARYALSELRVHPQDAVADVKLHFETGPRYFFGEVRVLQADSDSRLDDAVIARYVGIVPGDPYDPQVLLDTQFALGDLGYFQTIEPVPDREHVGEDRRVPITIRTTPLPPRRYDFGIGYGTDTGARVSAGAEFRQLNDAGHKFKLDTRLSEIKNTARGEYRIPQGIKPGEQLALAGELTQERYDAGDSLKYGLELSLSRTPGKWQRKIYLAYLHEESELGDDVQTSDLLMPGVSFNRSELDDPIYTRRGWSLFADVHGAQRGALSSTTFAQFRSQVRGAWAFDRRYRLLGRAEFGASVVADFEELPASQRFFAGGDQSVRGYRYQSLGPKDEDGNVIGGRYLTTASLEAEMRVVGDWGVAAFYDIGGAGDEPGPKLFQGIGLGLRYRAPVGSIQVDVAHPLDDPDGGVRLHLGVRVGL
ncbi:MAG TPA: autotransporter assembly complex family protein [Solimonas sp.]